MSSYQQSAYGQRAFGTKKPGSKLARAARTLTDRKYRSALGIAPRGPKTRYAQATSGPLARKAAMQRKGETY